MTRKDYELIAAAVHRSLMASTISGSTAVKAAKTEAIRLVAIDLAASLATTNDRFDRARFLKACGVSS